MAHIAIPKFASEAEEAAWWFEHQDELLEEFKDASAEGRLGMGTAMRRALAADSTIQLDAEDVSRARAVAERKGMQYQAYVKMLIHEALEKESAA
jgi:predicted DNA binding CopG/RHH family protein